MIGEGIVYMTYNPITRGASVANITDLFASPAAAEAGLVAEVLHVDGVGHLLTLLLVAGVNTSLAKRTVPHTLGDLRELTTGQRHKV